VTNNQSHDNHDLKNLKYTEAPNLEEQSF